MYFGETLTRFQDHPVQIVSDNVFRPPMLKDRRPIPTALSVSLSVCVCHIVYCGQTVHDRPMVYIEVE